jgi:hypothetical protein
MSSNSWSVPESANGWAVAESQRLSELYLASRAREIKSAWVFWLLEASWKMVTFDIDDPEHEGPIGWGDSSATPSWCYFEHALVDGQFTSTERQCSTPEWLNPVAVASWENCFGTGDCLLHDIPSDAETTPSFTQWQTSCNIGTLGEGLRLGEDSTSWTTVAHLNGVELQELIRFSNHLLQVFSQSLGHDGRLPENSFEHTMWHFGLYGIEHSMVRWFAFVCMLADLRLIPTIGYVGRWQLLASKSKGRWNLSGVEQELGKWQIFVGQDESYNWMRTNGRPWFGCYFNDFLSSSAYACRWIGSNLNGVLGDAKDAFGQGSPSPGIEASEVNAPKDESISSASYLGLVFETDSAVSRCGYRGIPSIPLTPQQFRLLRFVYEAGKSGRTQAEIMSRLTIDARTLKTEKSRLKVALLPIDIDLGPRGQYCLRCTRNAATSL